jgi:hypothetical protein
MRYKFKVLIAVVALPNYLRLHCIFWLLVKSSDFDSEPDVSTLLVPVTLTNQRFCVPFSGNDSMKLKNACVIQFK